MKVTENSYAWRQGVPWLRYNEIGEAISKSERFTLRVAFDPTSVTAKNQFDLWVAKYHANGSFIALEPIQTNFFLCPKTTIEQLSNFKRFGANTKHECSFDLLSAINTTETIFYEMFVRDADGHLVDVPVRILNLVHSISRTFYSP